MTKRKTKKKSNVETDSELQERLLKGERVITKAVIHDGIFWQAAVVFVASLLIAFFIVWEIGLLLMCVAVLMALYAAARKSILMLIVTNKRVFARYGLLQIDVVDVHFDKIESVELERMLPGFIMGYANIVIMGTGNRYIVIPYVANARQVRRAYNEQVLTDDESDKEETKG